jgi:PAS domain S-box-containing protein
MIDEQRLFDSIRPSPIATVITNPRLPDNPIVATNDAFVALTGYGQDEIIGRNCRFLAGPGTEPWLTERIRAAVASRSPTLTELLNYRKDGTPFRNAVMVAPIMDEDGEPAFFLGSQVDIGEGPAAARRAEAVQLVASLSPRQLQILSLMADGRLTKQIAYQLGLAEKTVKMHRGILFTKLRARAASEAVRIAVEAGL